MAYGSLVATELLHSVRATDFRHLLGSLLMPHHPAAPQDGRHCSLPPSPPPELATWPEDADKRRGPLLLRAAAAARAPRQAAEWPARLPHWSAPLADGGNLRTWLAIGAAAVFLHVGGAWLLLNWGSLLSVCQVAPLVLAHLISRGRGATLAVRNRLPACSRALSLPYHPSRPIARPRPSAPASALPLAHQSSPVALLIACNF